MTNKQKIAALIEVLIPDESEDTNISQKLLEAVRAIALEEYAAQKAKLAEFDEEEGAAAWDAAADSGIFDLLDALQQVKAFPLPPTPRRWSAPLEGEG